MLPGAVKNLVSHMHLELDAPPKEQETATIVAFPQYQKSRVLERKVQKCKVNEWAEKLNPTSIHDNMAYDLQHFSSRS